MRLAEFQKLMAEDVMRPLTRQDGIDRRNRAAGYVKPNDRLTAPERLEIYNRSYWFRILDSLYEDFPGLRAVLGDRRFTKLSEAYLTAHPSSSFTMGRLGWKLEAWLAANPRWAGRDIGLALDMVRLEWAHIEAFDAAELKVIGPEDLAEFDPSLEFELQPYVRLLALEYPVDELRLRVNASTERGTAASNAVTEKHRGTVGPKTVRIRKSPVFVAVHRHDGYVYYRRIEASEFAVLDEISRGGRLGTVLNRAARTTALPDGEFQYNLQVWFAAWSQLGWLCHRRTGSKKETNS
jgi:hypothetical protein